MKIFVASTSTNNVNTVLESLARHGDHEVVVFHYDQKWQQWANPYLKQHPEHQGLVALHKITPLREQITCDKEIIEAAKDVKPDIVLYVSAWNGEFVPQAPVFHALRERTPVIHLLFDGSDPPWWPLLDMYEKEERFSLTVNIDGNRNWPGDCPVNNNCQRKLKGLTLLTPVDTNHFEPFGLRFHERPFAVGYGGNSYGYARNALIGRMDKEVRGFHYRPRDTVMDSYRNYAEFLCHCRVVLSVPFSGSQRAKQVKGRAVETGFAGACLLDWQSDTMRGWFVPRLEFMDYDSTEAAIETANWLAARPRLCEEVANLYKTRMWAEHSPKIFWEKVFSAVER